MGKLQWIRHKNIAIKEGFSDGEPLTIGLVELPYNSSLGETMQLTGRSKKDCVDLLMNRNEMSLNDSLLEEPLDKELQLEYLSGLAKNINRL